MSVSPSPHTTIAEPRRRASVPWVGIYGPAGVGKDSLAAALIEAGGFVRIAFADPVRAMALAIDPLVPYAYHIERTEAGGATYKHHARLSEVIELDGWEKAKRDIPEVRRILQRVGTEALRSVDSDFWVRQGMAKAQRSDSPVVFTDARFPNEAHMIRNMGGLTVKIEGDKDTGVPAHESETAMRDWSPDIIVRNPKASPEVYTKRLTEAATTIITHLLKGLT